MTGRAELRWVRALTLASVMLAVGCSGHAAAGGLAPPTALLGPMLVVITMAVAPFLRTPASTWRVVVLVLVGQGMLHAALVVLGSSAPGHAPMAGSAGTGMAQMAPGTATTSMAAPSMGILGQAHAGMLLGHVVAALLVMLWLAAGERAAWRLVGVSALRVATTWRALGAAWRLGPALVVSLPARARFAEFDVRPTSRSVLEPGGGLSRRGPPRVCAA